MATTAPTIGIHFQKSKIYYQCALFTNVSIQSLKNPDPLKQIGAIEDKTLMLNQINI